MRAFSMINKSTRCARWIAHGSWFNETLPGEKCGEIRSEDSKFSEI